LPQSVSRQELAKNPKQILPVTLFLKQKLKKLIDLKTGTHFALSIQINSIFKGQEF